MDTKEKVILLVEDNSDDVALTLRAFRKNNILNQVVIARDGEEALDYLFGRGSHSGRDLRQQPHLVLLDLKLPKLDGLAVLESLRADPRTRLLPVVVLTTSNEDRDILASYQLGANGFVRKPIDFEQFLEVVRQIGVFWLTLNVPPPVCEASA